MGSVFQEIACREQKVFKQVITIQMCPEKVFCWNTSQKNTSHPDIHSSSKFHDKKRVSQLQEQHRHINTSEDSKTKKAQKIHEPAYIPAHYYESPWYDVTPKTNQNTCGGPQIVFRFKLSCLIHSANSKLRLLCKSDFMDNIKQPVAFSPLLKKALST